MKLGILDDDINRLWGFGNPSPWEECIDHVHDRLRSYDPELVYTRGLPGLGKCVVTCCIEQRVPYVLVLPGYPIMDNWSDDARESYQRDLQCAQEVVYVTHDKPNAERNRQALDYIVFDSDADALFGILGYHQVNKEQELDEEGQFADYVRLATAVGKRVDLMTPLLISKAYTSFYLKKFDEEDQEAAQLERKRKPAKKSK